MAVAANRGALGNGLQHRGTIFENQQVLRLSLPLLERVAIAASQGTVTQPIIDDVELDIVQLHLNICVQLKVHVLSPTLVHGIAQGHVQRPMRVMLLEVAQVTEAAVCGVVGKLAAELVAREVPGQPATFGERL
ncbi:hypothetical protein D9M69_350140 [compost metagenome]